jgi:hypothetical protein
MKETNMIKNREELAIYFSELNFRVGAEIGVLGGDYSRFICQVNPTLKLYCVDSWGIGDKIKKMQDYHIRMHQRAKRKLALYNTVLIHKLSIDAVNDLEDEALDFVYIDANHLYASVVEDINAWGNKVRHLGIVSGHDYDTQTVKEAVDAYVKTYNYELELTGGDKKGIQSWWFVKK